MAALETTPSLDDARFRGQPLDESPQGGGGVPGVILQQRDAVVRRADDRARARDQHIDSRTGDRPAGLIDFDDAAPGRRIEDLAYLAWVFCSLGPGGPSVAEQSRRIDHVCAAYAVGSPLGTPIALGFVDALLAQHDRIAAMRRLRAERAVDPEERAYNVGRALEIDASRVWMQSHRSVLDRSPG